MPESAAHYKPLLYFLSMPLTEEQEMDVSDMPFSISRSDTPYIILSYSVQLVRTLIGMVILRNFLAVDSLSVNGPPGIDNVCQDKRNKEADVEHGLERELA